MLRVGDETAEVTFRIDVTGDHRLKTASGHLTGDEEFLFRAFDARGATLITEDGDELAVILTRQSGSHAAIAVNSAVPGI